MSKWTKQGSVSKTLPPWSILRTLRCALGVVKGVPSQGYLLSWAVAPAIGMTKQNTQQKRTGQSVLSFPGIPLAHRTTLTLSYGAVPTGRGHTM